MTSRSLLIVTAVVFEITAAAHDPAMPNKLTELDDHAPQCAKSTPSAYSTPNRQHYFRPNNPERIFVKRAPVSSAKAPQTLSP
jgi:hypothetical protein